MGDVACVMMRSRQGASNAVPCVESIATIAKRIDVGYRCTLVDIALFTRLAHLRHLHKDCCENRHRNGLSLRCRSQVDYRYLSIGTAYQSCPIATTLQDVYRPSSLLVSSSYKKLSSVLLPAQVVIAFPHPYPFVGEKRNPFPFSIATSVLC
jgi:hypothetical protein